MKQIALLETLDGMRKDLGILKEAMREGAEVSTMSAISKA